MKRKATKIVELVIADDSKELTIDAISLVTSPAIEQDFVFFGKENNNLTLAKVDEEKRMLVSPALIPNKQIFRYDPNTDSNYYVYFSKETVRQAGVGEDQVTKSEMNRVSSLVVKEVTISGYEIADTKLVQLDNGNYRSFILLEYPIAQVYKAFINRVEGNENLKSNITALKNTDAFKELEQYVSEFSSGA